MPTEPAPLLEYQAPRPQAGEPDPPALPPPRAGGRAPTTGSNGRRLVWFVEKVCPLEGDEPRGLEHPFVSDFDRWAELLRWSDAGRERLRAAIAKAPRGGCVAINIRGAAIETSPTRFSWVAAK